MGPTTVPTSEVKIVAPMGFDFGLDCTPHIEMLDIFPGLGPDPAVDNTSTPYWKQSAATKNATVWPPAPYSCFGNRNVYVLNAGGAVVGLVPNGTYVLRLDIRAMPLADNENNIWSVQVGKNTKNIWSVFLSEG